MTYCAKLHCEPFRSQAPPPSLEWTHTRFDWKITMRNSTRNPIIFSSSRFSDSRCSLQTFRWYLENKILVRTGVVNKQLADPGWTNFPPSVADFKRLICSLFQIPCPWAALCALISLPSESHVRYVYRWLLWCRAFGSGLRAVLNSA